MQLNSKIPHTDRCSLQILDYKHIVPCWLQECSYIENVLNINCCQSSRDPHLKLPINGSYCYSFYWIWYSSLQFCLGSISLSYVSWYLNDIFCMNEVFLLQNLENGMPHKMSYFVTYIYQSILDLHWHLLPIVPFTQIHVKLNNPSTQVPPLLHGLLAHSFPPKTNIVKTIISVSINLC